MPDVRLIHWNATEAQDRLGRLQALGYTVNTDLPPGPELFRQLRNDPPQAIVIDLSRLPSQGRDVALSIRSFAATRRVPLIFVEGDPAKLRGIKELLPDAVYTTWAAIGPDLERAIANPPAEPVKPSSVFAGYSGRPLPTKLGIKPQFVVALLKAPDDFLQTLGDLPAGVQWSTQADEESDLILWFVRAGRELAEGMPGLARIVQKSSLWIIWPKKASGVVSDVSEPAVRAAGLAQGLVDFKVAAIDATWSGLLFRRRKQAK